MKGFVNSDWAHCVDDRKSRIGYVFMLGGGLVSWESKKQRTVVVASAEVKLTEAIMECVHFRHFLMGLDAIELTISTLTLLFYQYSFVKK